MLYRYCTKQTFISDVSMKFHVFLMLSVVVTIGSITHGDPQDCPVGNDSQDGVNQPESLPDVPNVVLHEYLNVNDPFIELITSEESQVLDGFFVSVFDYQKLDTETSSTLNLRAVINLQGLTLKGIGYIGSNVPQNEKHLLSISSENNERIRFGKGVTPLKLFDIQQRARLIVILSYMPQNKPENLIMSSSIFKEEDTRPLRGKLRTLILRQGVDSLLVRGHQAPKECKNILDTFGDIISKRNAKFLLDIRSDPANQVSHSLCSSHLVPNQHQLWRQAKPTKGLPNDCPGKDFEAGPHLKELLDPTAGENINFDQWSGGPSSGTMPINSAKLNRAVKRAPKEQGDVADTDMGEIKTLLNAIQERKRMIKKCDASITDFDFDYDTERNFKPEWKTAIANDPRIPWAEVNEAKKWFELLDTGKFRCRICNTHKHTYKIPDVLWSDLSLDEGYLSEDVRINR